MALLIDWGSRELKIVIYVNPNDMKFRMKRNLQSLSTLSVFLMIMVLSPLASSNSIIASSSITYLQRRPIIKTDPNKMIKI